MNKTAFLKELEKRLKYLPKEDREDALEYYTELMNDMELSETDDVTEMLGSAKDAAKKILDECTQKHVDAYEENKTAKGRATIVWLTILGILSLPVSLPLAILVLGLAFALIAVLISLMLSLVAVSIALVVASLACFVFTFMAPGLAQKAVILGIGLTCLGLGVLLGFGLYYLFKMIINRIFHRKAKEN